jgi:hypothetical protein
MTPPCRQLFPQVLDSGIGNIVALEADDDHLAGHLLEGGRLGRNRQRQQGQQGGKATKTSDHRVVPARINARRWPANAAETMAARHTIA